MRGIYIHIPFCKQACRYCDFYFTVSLKYMDEFVDCLVEEISMRSRGNQGRDLHTLYLGGGTPSLLSESQLEKILGAIHRYHHFRKSPEWTIECNPDDLHPERISYLRALGFNRLSIGIQSFQEEELISMRRSHHAGQAEESVLAAREGGFKNISIDLIYGIPGQGMQQWEENLRKALSLPITHVSAYHLTFEPGTVFDHWRKKGRLIPVTEERSLEQYKLLRESLLGREFEHYELSNFARSGLRSEHNMIYWSGYPYMGLGPSAHSYDGERRSWNIPSLKGYLEGIKEGGVLSEQEELSTKEKYHDYLITSLRTRWGCDPGHVETHFGPSYREALEKKAGTFLEEGSMHLTGGHLAIHPDKWLITDLILRELFMD